MRPGPVPACLVTVAPQDWGVLITVTTDEDTLHDDRARRVQTCRTRAEALAAVRRFLDRAVPGPTGPAGDQI